MNNKIKLIQVPREPGLSRSRRARAMQGSLAIFPAARPSDSVVMTSVCHPRSAVRVISEALNYPYPATLVSGVNERTGETVRVATKNGYVLEAHSNKFQEPPWQFQLDAFQHQDAMRAYPKSLSQTYGRVR